MSALTLTGSCLCGAVQYEAVGEPANFFHCHCARCRKATGTGHASNVILAPGSVRYLAGEENIRVFRVPDAKFFANVFCANCGSRVPAFSEERGFALIPAGSVDGEIEMAPTGRIFRDSATRWSCGGDGIPAHERYPPRA